MVAGERRWRAAQRAGLTVVPVVVRQVRDDRELLELALVENLQRADLNSIEEAEAFRTLQENFDLSQEEIADRVGKARTAVTNTLRLLRLLPARFRTCCAAVSSPPARCDRCSRSPIADDQVRACPACGARRTSSAQDTGGDRQRRVGRGSSRRRAASTKPVEPHAAAAAERLTRELQTKVEIERRGKGGTIRIHFHSEEELIRLFERLTERIEGAEE